MSYKYTYQLLTKSYHLYRMILLGVLAHCPLCWNLLQTEIQSHHLLQFHHFLHPLKEKQQREHYTVIQATVFSLDPTIEPFTSFQMEISPYWKFTAITTDVGIAPGWGRLWPQLFTWYGSHGGQSLQQKPWTVKLSSIKIPKFLQYWPQSSIFLQ